MPSMQQKVVIKKASINSPDWGVLFSLIDAGCIWASIAVILQIYLPETGLSAEYVIVVALAMLIFICAAALIGVDRFWQSKPTHQLALQILLSWFSAVLVLLFLAYLTKVTATYSRVVLTAWFVCVPVSLVLWRVSVRQLLYRFYTQNYCNSQVAIVGDGEIANIAANTILHNPHYGMTLAGCYDSGVTDRAMIRDRQVNDAVGDIEQLMTDISNGKVNLIYIALPFENQKTIRNIIKRLTNAPAPVSVYVIPDVFTANVLSGDRSILGGLPVFSVYDTPFRGANKWIKRVEDVVLSLVIIVISAIPMLLIVFVIRISSPGPVLFKQMRCGLDGKRIEVWKFRTMVFNTKDSGVQARKKDPRITKVGTFLRKTSLDELPQFFNVLQGKMSIVGPRPHTVNHTEQYRRLIDGYMLRHKIKPGITGWAQVNGWRGRTETLEKMEKRVECDLWYIQNWSLWLDLKLIAKTIWVSFFTPSAY